MVVTLSMSWTAKHVVRCASSERQPNSQSTDACRNTLDMPNFNPSRFTVPVIFETCQKSSFERIKMKSGASDMWNLKLTRSNTA